MKYTSHLLNKVLGPEAQPTRRPLIPIPVPPSNIPQPWSRFLLEIITDIVPPLSFQRRPASCQTTNSYTKPTHVSICGSCILRTVFLLFRLDLVDGRTSKPPRTSTRAPSTAFSCTRTPKPASKRYSPVQKTSPSANGTFKHPDSLGSFTKST